MGVPRARVPASADPFAESKIKMERPVGGMNRLMLASLKKKKTRAEGG